MDLFLEGYNHKLYLRGKKNNDVNRVGSHGHEALQTDWYFEGIGKLTLKETNEEFFFTFKTLSTRFGKNATLEDFVFVGDKWQGEKFPRCCIIEEYLPCLVGEICIGLLEQFRLAKERGEEIPNVKIDALDYDKLFRLGFLKE